MTTPDNLIHTPADLRPGDIMLGPIGGAVGLGVGLGQLWLGEGFRIGRTSIRHVAVVTRAVDELGPLHMVEAMPAGAREWAGSARDRWDERYAYVRLPEDYPGQAEDAARVARLMVEEGVGYSFASYLALGLWRWGLKADRLQRWIDRRRDPVGVLDHGGEPFRVALPCRAICSVLADQAWTLAGHHVLEDVAPMAVTPGRLAAQLLGKRGAVWAFPRGAGLPARTWEV